MPFRSERQRRFMWSQHPEIAKKWAHEASGEPERSSHPWQAPEGVLARYGIRLSFDEQVEGNDKRLFVGIKDNGGREVGEVNLQYDPDRDVYQIYYSALHDMPRGEGLGTSVYRAIRNHVGQHYGKTVASDYTRSSFANRAWQGMAKAGIAKRRVTDLPGVPKSTRPGAGELDYYVMDSMKIERLALAASQGPIQLAMVEQRENSTAMVVVPGDPPGRNICDFVRRYVQERSKLIVIAQSGKLAPGNFERMMRASMPDVEKKLRIMDAGASLADALNAAERNRHYRPSQALEVYCDPQAARGFTQEITDGSLKFDPTVIHIVPTKIPSDDPGDIVDAVKGGDEQAMHRVLDAHIFSDQDGLADYRQALLGESVRWLVDEVLAEFLKDIADDDEAAVNLLASIIKKNRTLLSDRGIDVKGAKFLGNGANGAAWKLRSNRVLKVTTDDAEAHVAAHIKGKRFKHVFTIYDVWAFPGQHRGHHVYGLVTEEGLEKPDQYEQDKFDWMVGTLEEFAEEADVNLEDGLKQVLQTMMASKDIPNDSKRELLKMVKEFDLVGMMSDMRRLGVQADLHSGNFMRRPDGTFVIIDIGTGGSQESAKPPFLEGENIFDIKVPSLDDVRLNEFGSGAPGSGVIGPPTMRGSNSSSWASGRGALKEPENHIPDDENSTEQDSALDWGLGRISGASF